MDLSTYSKKNYYSLDTKLEILDKKWVKETMLWLCFIDIICLISIYRNSILFTKEARLDTTLEQLQKEYEKVSKDKQDSK